MSDLILLHWDQDAISAMSPPKGGSVAGGRFVPPETGFETDEAAGRWLKGQLVNSRISGKRAAILLPRAAVVLRKLTLPDVPENELPDLVRMQAATKSSTPLDRLRLDFVPLPSMGDQRPVLLASANAKEIGSILARVRAAGLEPAAVGVTPFATAARICQGDEATLIVAVEGTRAEINLCKAGVVQFSHGTDLSGEDDEEDRGWLVSEVSRAMVAADHLAAGGGLSRVVLIGRESLLEPLAASFQERFGCGVELIATPEALGLSESAGIELAALAAMLGQAEAGPMPRIDFLNPRKSVEKPDRTRLIRGLLAGGVAAAVLIAWFVGWWQRRDIESQIAALREERTTIEAALENGKPILDKRDAIQGWLDEEAVWTKQLAVLDEALPGTDRLYLSELSLQPGGREAWGISKGTIIMAGQAKTKDDYESSFANSLEYLGYKFEPPEAARSQGDDEYPYGFAFHNIAVPQAADAGK